MPINLIYTRLFEINLLHGFYTDGNAKGIRLRPSPETKELLQNGQMLFKATPNRVLTYYKAQADEVTPLVALTQNPRFVFTLTVDDKAEFVRITDLEDTLNSKDYESSNILFFSNNPAAPSTNPAAPENLQYELLDSVEPQLFTFEFTVAGNPASVRCQVRDRDNNLVSPGKDTDGNPLPDNPTLSITSSNNFVHQIDLRGRDNGRYNLVVRNAADTTTLLTRRIYVHNTLNAQDILGIVELDYLVANLYNGTKYFDLEFDSLATRWRYFIVNKFGTVVIDPTLTVVDTNLPANYNPQAATTVNDIPAAVFTSPSTISFAEASTTGIELRQGANVVVAHLPNAPINGVIKEVAGTLESEIFVFV